MPNICIDCLDIPVVQKLSQELTVELAKVMDCPVDWVTFLAKESGKGKLFCDGKTLYDTVFIHVEWFDRGEEVKGAVAKILTEAILGTNQFENTKIETVTVIFVALDKSDFYENGIRY